MKSKSISPALSKRIAAVPLGWPAPNVLGQSEMFMKKVVFDLHGPILDYASAACDLASKLYGVKLSPDQVKFYNMAFDKDFPLTPFQFNNVFVTLARLGRGGYGDLGVRPGTQELFKALHAAGIATEIWTWVPGAAEHNHETRKAYGTGIAQAATYDLIRELGLVEHVERQVRFIKPDAKVPEMMKDHLPLIIEDNPVTAVTAGYSYGHACILTPEPYNEHLSCPGVLRLNSHAELAPAIIDFFEKLEKAGAIIGGAR